MAEGAPLLREYGLIAHRGFESLSLRHFNYLTDSFKENIISGLLKAPVAQLDRVPGYEPGGREFESLRARHTIIPL